MEWLHRNAAMLLLLIVCLFSEAYTFPNKNEIKKPILSIRTTRTSRDFRLSDSLQRQAEMSQEKAQNSLEDLDRLSECKSGTQARIILEQTLLSDDTGVSSTPAFFGSISIPTGASSRGISDGDLAIQTKIRNKKYSIMDLIELSGDRDADRASLAVFCVFTASTISALVANQNMPGPEILRFLVVWLLSFSPLALVGVGIATPAELQTTLVSIQRSLFPSYRKRMLQHEAGHFLMGHLLGLPIQGYSSNAVKNAVSFYPLNDPDFGRNMARQLGFDPVPANRVDESATALSNLNGQVEASSSYFSKEGRGAQTMERSVFRDETEKDKEGSFGELPERDQPSASWPFRGFDDETLDKLSVVSVGGVCAEILAFGNAEGGVADLSQLRQFYSNADPVLNDREQDNRIRFALGYTMTQLRCHLGALDELAAVMEKDGSVADCVRAIEMCKNPSGNDAIMGDSYEVRRRQQFRTENIGWLEGFLLGGGKNAEIEEDRLVEGKGGGYIKQNSRLTGDDPFYLAMGVAAIFLLWASSGGLSLH